jgi:hypothetical protein
MPDHCSEFPAEAKPFSPAPARRQLVRKVRPPEEMASCVQQVSNIRRDLARSLLVVVLCCETGAIMQRMVQGKERA